MVASRMEDYEAESLRQGTRKSGLDGFHYRRTIRENEVVGCSVMEKLAEGCRDNQTRTSTGQSDAA